MPYAHQIFNIVFIFNWIYCINHDMCGVVYNIREIFLEGTRTQLTPSAL